MALARKSVERSEEERGQANAGGTRRGVGAKESEGSKGDMNKGKGWSRWLRQIPEQGRVCDHKLRSRGQSGFFLHAPGGKVVGLTGVSDLSDNLLRALRQGSAKGLERLSKVVGTLSSGFFRSREEAQVRMSV